MGIIKAAFGAVGGALADSWLEAIEPDAMSDTTVMSRGVKVRRDDKRSSNTKASDNIISNGSLIHVYPNQFMLLVEGGKVVDYTAEEGYYTVDNSAMPSLFNGQFKEALHETWQRFKYGGTPGLAQKVFFINMQEIKGIKFGTPTPVQYFDNFYNAELFLRAHGNYSIKIIDPMLFFFEAIPRDAETVDIEDINEQYLAEFLSALQTAINKMSADGLRVSFAASKSQELSQYMADVLDDGWKAMRGFEVRSVGLSSISYDEESQKLINMRNAGAMLGDPKIREGYVQGSVARGIEAAGSNEGGAGAMGAFMGVGLGMNAGGNFMGAASSSNQAQMAAQQNQAAAATPAAGGWTCECGNANPDTKFCGTCGKKRPAPAATKFCGNCSQPLPEGSRFCPECGKQV
jgi:membrane protease subunit (stomatin/prohibitin family)